MPRPGSHAALVHQYLTRRRNGGTLPEIVTALREARGPNFLPRSVRSAIYTHLVDRGERLFVKAGRARYAVRR